MGPTAPYLAMSEADAADLLEYQKRWDNRGMSFTHFVQDDEERALWVRRALRRGRPISPQDFGKTVWFEPGGSY